MPIPEEERAFVAKQFEDLTGPVKIDYFHQTESTVMVAGRRPCISCEGTKEVLEELAGLSEKITLTIYEFPDERELAAKNKIEIPPGIVVRGEINRPIRIVGMPGGIFMPLLIQSILSSAGKPPDPPSEMKTTLKKLRTTTLLRVIGSMMDPALGDAAIAAIALSLLSDKIDATIFNLDEFPDLGMQLGLTHSPATVINDAHGFAGVTTAEELVRYLYDLEAHPDHADLKPPAVAPGSTHPWQPPASPDQQPAPPPGPSSGPPAGGPRRRQPPPDASSSGGAPAGMRRTSSGLVVPN